MAEGRNGTVYFQKVPILYSPWLSFSLNNERKSGFLSPTFGSSSDSGLELTLPYYWNIAPNMDATIAPRVYAKRGLQLGSEFRYLDHGNYIGRSEAKFAPRILPSDNHARWRQTATDSRCDTSRISVKRIFRHDQLQPGFR